MARGPGIEIDTLDPGTDPRDPRRTMADSLGARPQKMKPCHDPSTRAITL